MFFRYIKKFAFYSGIALIIGGGVLSCDNPFSNSLGAKVDVSPPTIIVKSPVAGAYLKGITKFEGNATAYRELRGVEVKIFSQDQDEGTPTPILDWSSEKITLIGGDSRQKDWAFELDTDNYEYAVKNEDGTLTTVRGLQDGFLKVQFRAIDPSQNTPTVELVYIVKNNPSVIKMTAPDINRLDDSLQPPTLITNTEIRGQIIDRRGLKPGYPMIKIWNVDEFPTEPAGDDPQHGWMSLFLSGVDYPDRGTGFYADRENMPVVRAASFVFKLSDFRRDPQTRRIMYQGGVDGNYTQLQPGRYRFRIISSDSYFNSDADNNPDYTPDMHLFPRGPLPGEEEIVGYYPSIDQAVDTDPLNQGPSWVVMVKSSGSLPTIELHNEETPEELTAKPNIYITEMTTKKIVTGTAERPEFRLQILALHPDKIGEADLFWEHSGVPFRSGKLEWDKPAEDKGDGKVFTFTAKGGLLDEFNQPIFVSNSEPYTLRVEAYSMGDIDSPGIQNYTLYLDGVGPEVSIRSLRGAADPPADDSEPVLGGTMNKSPYTVNGNIQVAVDRSAGMGILLSDGTGPRPVVKWIVQEEEPFGVDEAAYLAANEKPDGTKTIYRQLQDYRSDPTPAGRAFFDAIQDETAVSGWVEIGDLNGQFDTDKLNNLKFNTRNISEGKNVWDGKYLWLYIIAEDGVNNLGYTMQRLYVDEESDKPRIITNDISPIDDGHVTDKSHLFVNVDDVASRMNVLDRDQGISLTFIDDDGISLNEGGISIQITDLAVYHNDGVDHTGYLTEEQISKTVSGRDYLVSGNSLQWTGMLKQETMADALSMGDTLHDGLYELTITIRDNAAVKVAIGDQKEESVSTTKTYIFAVQSHLPEITIDYPAENSMQSAEPREIYGSVKSRFKIQQASITFDPALSGESGSGPGHGAATTEDGFENEIETIPLLLYPDKDCTPGTDFSVADWKTQEYGWDEDEGYYIYYWKIKGVVFDRSDLYEESPGVFTKALFEWRRFTVSAWDGLGYSTFENRTVTVDNVPPVVELSSFNSGRPVTTEGEFAGKFTVNGKVQFEIGATDLNGIGTSDGGKANVRWWILPKGGPAFPADPKEGWKLEFPSGTAGAGGVFNIVDHQGSGRYRAWFDSTKLTDKTVYVLYAMAEDNAGNLSEYPSGGPVMLEEFTVYQDGDLPVLSDLSPPDRSSVATVRIMGKISDDDGFTAARAADYALIQFDNGGSPVQLPVSIDTLGNLNFNLNPDNVSPADKAYFAFDGSKQYRIIITDDEELKNPDTGLWITDSGRHPAAKVYFPSETGWYSFTLKTTPPRVLFKQNDPTRGKVGGGEDDPARQFIPRTDDPTESGTAGYKYESRRPVFATGAQLAQALYGGYVQDGSLAVVSFTYVGSPSRELFPASNPLPYTLIENRYYWDIPDAWLAPFETGTEGMHSIIIEAADSGGNKARVEWSFYKDQTPPHITMNINEVTDLTTDKPSVISGENIILKGTFRDDFAEIGDTYSYCFDGKWMDPVTIDDAHRKSKSADWQVNIPDDFADGEHTFAIKVADSVGNPVETPHLYFIIDRANPVMSGEDEMYVSVLNLGGQKLSENQRVFSAAETGVLDDTSIIITLSGLVYDYTLSQLTASIYPKVGDSNPIVVYLPGIDEWRRSLDPASPVYYDASFDDAYVNNDSTPTPGILSIKPATPVEIQRYEPWRDADNNSVLTKPDDYNYVYLWTLNVTKGDIGYLITQDSNEATRRQIVMNARDMAGQDSGRKNWHFYLDSSSPEIEFLNLSYSTLLTYTPTILESNTISLQGIVTDNTKVKEIKYRIAKWDYSAGSGVGAWLYHDGSGWNVTAAPGNDAAHPWPSLLAADYADNPKNTVYWTLDSAALATSNVYPATLFDTEGKYRLDLYVIDYSISGDPATAGNPFTHPGVEFFVDRSDPVIVWDESYRKDFYRVINNELVFKFNISDPNTIDGSITAVLKNAGGTPIVNFPVPPAAISGNTWDTSRDVTLALPMGTSLNEPGASGRYTLEVMAKDGAGRSGNDDYLDKIDFYLDNNPPAVTINPSGGNEAIVGRVVIRGKFEKSNPHSPVSRVAFYIPGSTPGAPAVIPDYVNVDASGNIVASGGTEVLNEGAVLDKWLLANGWHFAGDGDSYKLSDGDDRTLAEIDDGLATANIMIPNTRNFLNSGYMGGEENAPSSLTFGGQAIPGTDKVQKLVIYVLAVDGAGNRNIQPCEYWVYPEGDRPKVGAMVNPREFESDGVTLLPDVQRLLNGRIRVSGSATDNVRVKNVWIRVFKDESATAVTNLRIPEWDENWDAKASYQTARTVNGSYGWFMANGGGGSEVSWWVYINTEGELDPSGGGKQKIRIEAMAEDTTWNDSLNNGAYEASPDFTGMFSKNKHEDAATGTAGSSITAYVISGAPKFNDELVLNGASAGSFGTNSLPDPAKWESVLTASLSGRASYSIRVSHETGLRNIRWIRADGTGIDLLADYNPDSLDTDSKTYITLTYAADLANMDTAIPSGPGIAVQATEPVFNTTLNEWESYVIVDINSAIIRGPGGKVYDGSDQRADPYELVLRATETSSSVPLTSEKTAEIPIDNLPPESMYTHSTNVAGSSPTFGGVAGDKGRVSGLSRVIVWLSRSEGGAETSIPWEELGAGGSGSAGHTFAGYDKGSAGYNAYYSGVVNLDSKLPTNVQVPIVADKSDTSGNYSSIVIDQNDPMGSNQHHGHQLRMGWATVGGELAQAWYVVLDSTRITSGRTTIHFIVYDKAGNATYHNQKLMIMNNVPRISRIKLGTDIRGAGDMQNRFPNNGTGGAGGNYSYKSSEAGAMQPMRSLFGFSNESRDTAVGISEYIPINTTVLGDYGVLYDEAFNVRNKLLAIQVDLVNESGSSSGKDRHFRVEYVSGTRHIVGVDNLLDSGGIKAGRVYIIDNPGSSLNQFPWGSFGAQGGNYRRGLAFLAIEDGDNMDIPDRSLYEKPGEYPSVWELNSTYYSGSFFVSDPGGTGASNFFNRQFPPGASALTLNDVDYTPGALDNNSAEFVYRANAFSGNPYGTPYTQIHDINPILNDDGRPAAYNPVDGNRNPWEQHSLFIIRVFDAVRANFDDELFGDFALLSIRVNNNDTTPPFAQLYDLNPKTEGVDDQQTLESALRPSGMGQNRSRGGLYNTVGSTLSIDKSGHIEPRSNTSLNSLEMGGAVSGPGTLGRPFAHSAAYFDYDTVSGQVIIRGYAEDDQRIDSVALHFYRSADPAETAAAQTGDFFNILERNTSAASTSVPVSGLLQAAANANATGRIQFTEILDLNRHRVEWAYYWDTETVPANWVVGNLTVRAVAHNARSGDPANPPASPKSSERIDQAAASTVFDYFNPSFPTPSTGNFRRYNTIRVNVRPYITGFVRNKNEFSHDIRSRQGRYLFARQEAAVVEGFNLGSTGYTTAIILPGGRSVSTSPVGTTAFTILDTSTATSTTKSLAGAAQIGAFDLPSDNAARYRIFQVPYGATDAAATGNGLVRLTVTVSGSGANAGSYQAVNTGDNSAGGRSVEMSGGTTVANATMVRPAAIQPWNIERNPGIEGSDLWDDFTMVHIWQSTNTNTGTAGDNNAFRSTGGNWVVESPAMSIDPGNGRLYASWNEGGNGGNTGTTVVSDNSLSTATNPTVRIRFIDPIIHSDIYYSTGGGTTATAADVWAVSSIIGRNGSTQSWTALGGVYFYGPGGGNPGLSSGLTSQYLVESTYYNASTEGVNPGTVAVPPSTDQFENPHIVTSYSGGSEHIHVSYYDVKDHSVKYRHNTRGAPGTINAIGTADNNYNNNRVWINLDGGYDSDDMDTYGAPTEATDYTLLGLHSNIPILENNRYIRQVHVANYSAVTAGQTIYTLGSADPNVTTGTTTITAPMAGTISNLYQANGGKGQVFNNGAFGTSGTGNTTWGANNSGVVWSATNNASQNTYLYYAVANGAHVDEGDTIYEFGRNPRNGTNDVIIKAQKSGTISGLAYTPAQANGSRPAGTTATPNVSFTITGNVATYFSNTTNITPITPGANNSGRTFSGTGNNRNNWLRSVVPNNTHVDEGDIIYRFTQNPDSATNEIVIKAQKSGTISNLQYTPGQIGSQMPNAAGTPNVTFIITSNFTNKPEFMDGILSVEIPGQYEIENAILDADGQPVLDGDGNPTFGPPSIIYITTTGYHDRAFTISHPSDNTYGIMSRIVDSVERNNKRITNRLSDAGRHNSIAVTAEGYPVVAYFDRNNQRLKLAVSNNVNPAANNNWIIRDYVIPSNNLSSYGTGEYVSVKVDPQNRVHIAALNSVNKQLVYVTGQLNPVFTTGNTTQNDGGVLTGVTVQVVDSVGDVGRWCSLSLDADGNPWIAYQDESYSGSKDGAKVAYRDTGRFYKGGAGYFSGSDKDVYNGAITGWEAMHVPTQFRVENARVGLECFPTIRNITPDTTKFWGAAVGYLSPNFYRIAYYVK